MASLLLAVVDNFTEGIHKIKCKDCDCFLEHKSVKVTLIKYTCVFCNKHRSNKLYEKLKNKT